MPVRRPQSYVRTCLPALFIKSHHHGCRTILLDGTRMLQEFIFPLLQGDGVDDGLALQAFQSGHNHFPLRGVYHDGNTGNLRFRSYQMEESRHLHLSIQQPVVHIYIDDLCTVFHLLAGNAERLVIFLSLIRRKNLREPATLQRSPTFTKLFSGFTSRSSSPESQRFSGLGTG